MEEKILIAQIRGNKTNKTKYITIDKKEKNFEVGKYVKVVLIDEKLIGLDVI